jgi:hypothetical protein
MGQADSLYELARLRQNDLLREAELVWLAALSQRAVARLPIHSVGSLLTFATHPPGEPGAEPRPSDHPAFTPRRDPPRA